MMGRLRDPCASSIRTGCQSNSPRTKGKVVSVDLDEASVPTIPFRGRDWPRVIGSVLAPGGLVPTFDFQTPPDRALGFVGVEPTTYIGDPTPMTYRTTR